MLVLADPYPAAGLKDVRIALAPSSEGFALDVANRVTPGDVPSPARQSKTKRSTDQAKTEDIRTFLRHK